MSLGTNACIIANIPPEWYIVRDVWEDLLLQCQTSTGPLHIHPDRRAHCLEDALQS